MRPEELAAALVRRERRRRERAQGRAERLRRAVIDQLVAELRAGRFERAWLIGSLAWGDVHERSDVDVVVEGLAADEAGSLWNELSEASGVPVDLLRLEDLGESFRRRVETEGEAVHVP